MSNIDYEEQLAAEENKKQAALSQNDQLYTDMIEKSNQFYQEQQNAVENWKETQSQLQQQQTDFTIQQIEQQKEQKQKDYIKEQKGAYTDWKRQSNEYGVQAEQMADAGLGNTGVSESAKVSGYNTYQNRIIAARDSLNLAFLNYENGMKEAQLQNSSALAQLVYESYVKQVELAFSGFQHENQLLLEQADRRMEIEAMYDNRYQAILDQINGDGQIKPSDDEEPLVSGPVSGAIHGIVNKGEDQNIGNDSSETNNVDNMLGNSSDTINLSDYFFSNGYQPRYVNNMKLIDTGTTTSHLPSDLGVPKGQSIWQTTDSNGKKQYYVWLENYQTYMDVTEDFTFSNGYQPKYIGNAKLNDTKSNVSAITKNGYVKDDNGIPWKISNGEQAIWEAKGEYYVWVGSEKRYVKVTKSALGQW